MASPRVRRRRKLARLKELQESLHIEPKTEEEVLVDPELGDAEKEQDLSKSSEKTKDETKDTGKVTEEPEKPASTKTTKKKTVKKQSNEK